MNSGPTIVLAALTGVVLVIGVWFWNERVRRWPLATFGIDNGQRVLRWESAELREAVWRRGWMTSHEWLTLNRRQLVKIEAEIARRDGNPVL